MIQELLPDRNGSLKIGVVVEEYWPTWAIDLQLLEYQLLKIYAPARFRKFITPDTPVPVEQFSM